MFDNNHEAGGEGDGGRRHDSRFTFSPKSALLLDPSRVTSLANVNLRIAKLSLRSNRLCGVFTLAHSTYPFNIWTHFILRDINSDVDPASLNCKICTL
jgi:hypothetical protein